VQQSSAIELFAEPTQGVACLTVSAVLGPIEVVTRRLIGAVSLGSLCGALAAAFGATLLAQIAVVAAVCAVGLFARRLGRCQFG
jgi:hypothetical protein